MKKSLQFAAATGAALALLGPPALAQGTAPGNAGANRSALGPERTDDAGAVGRQGAPTADRAAPDQEPGRGAAGRTFAPDSSPAARPPAADGVKPPAAHVPRSPPTGDASGGDRRTAAPVTLTLALRDDPVSPVSTPIRIASASPSSAA
jgi:hypothetical protein